jgi:hypothetical protein
MRTQQEETPNQRPPLLDRSQDEVRFRWQRLTVLLALFGFYLLMFLRYRPYDVDNPWFLSFSYNACIEHISTDEFLQVKFPNGMDGTQYFGRIAAFLQCAVLNHAGWQQWPAEILTAVLVVAALWLWSIQLRKLGYSRTFISIFLLATGLSEPFLSAANRFRYESISFFMLSLGLTLITYESFFWGMFLGVLAVEIEPIALAGLIPLVVLSCTIKNLSRRDWACLVGGAACGGAVYVALHLNMFPGHFPSFSHGAGGQLGGFVATYFRERMRHLPELCVLVTAAFFYWRRRHTIRLHYAAVSALLIVLFSFLMSHGNPAYMIFLYPFLIVASLSAIQIERTWKPVLAIILVYFLSQYAVLAYLNRNRGFRTGDIRQVSDAVQQIARDRNIDDSRLRIYGDYRLWFAHPRNYRAAALFTANNIQDADLYICFNQPPDIVGLQPQGTFYCQDILQRIPAVLHPIRVIEVRSNALYFYVR